MSFDPQVSELHPVRTGDGSFTLRSEALGEQYHSIHGAVQESMHVYIRAGLHAVKKDRIDVLEIGLGTGLNALLTWAEAERLGVHVDYHALEPHRLSEEVIRVVDHPGHLGMEERGPDFLRMMSTGQDAPIDLGDHFRFRVSHLMAQQVMASSAFDLVYFDAFAPGVQPEMWTEDVFMRLFNAMRPSALLVTYCAKGEVRRSMRRAGFAVERLKGPQGKAEMLRARKPST